jgi:hypothetical protein
VLYFQIKYFAKQILIENVCFIFRSNTLLNKFKLKMCFIFSIPKGQVTVLVVGGALEAANSDKDCLKLVLNRRKGFVKLALRFGVDLVPTFSFGEYSIYDQVPNPVGKTVLFFGNSLFI